MSDRHITIDGKEVELIEQYEEKFGCVPTVAFLVPPTSKKMISESLSSNRPFNESDISDDWEFSFA